MDVKLIDLTTKKLLEKFGAGDHKPGSGSASALLGMLSAQMLKTVIDLTNEDKRKALYSEYLPKLLKIKSEIESRLYPNLESLFQEDSEIFDQVINLRRERDKETDPLQRRLKADEALEMLKPATEILFKIAKLSIGLGDFAVFVFDHGFKSARGDSAVALNSAVSAISSCLSIIELNLISLAADKWLKTIIEQKTSIKLKYNQLSIEANNKHDILENELAEDVSFYERLAIFRAGNLAATVKSNNELEAMVRKLQNALWVERDNIWSKNKTDNPLDLLKPDIVLKKVMGYTYIQSTTLGTYSVGDEFFEVAGLIDKSKRLVNISTKFSTETRNFTAAHELGHAILHKQTVLHRDKPIDGSSSIAKDIIEVQADKFAAYFLMPGKLVEKFFTEIFETKKFVITESSALALRVGNIVDFKRKCKDIRGLARILASAEFYGGKSFNSLSKIFEVSTETMAIRLEELDLLEF